MIKSMVQYLREDAARYPKRTALADEQGSITYEEYYHMAGQIGGYIIRHLAGDQIKRPVAVLIDRNLLSVVTFLGIAMSGNFYVPIDPAMPEKRRDTILRELDPVAVLDARDGAVPTEGVTAVCAILDEASADTDAFALAESRMDEIIDTDPLYAIFTSGSTGIPKGVLISHRSVIDLVASFGEVFGFDAESVFGNQAPFDFDVSVKDIYNALASGGCVQVIPKKLFVMPKLLIPYLAERGVNTLIWAVSAVRIVSDFKVLGSCEEAKSLKLRYVMFSGEVMPVKAVNYWMDFFGDTRFVNLYGPTEITCNCTYHILEKRYDPDSMLPVGRAFPNMRVFLLDENQKRITQPDQVGEICVAGTGLALGYYHRPEKTAECFVQDPQTSGYQDLIYHTGDLGYYDREHLLFFASRADSQIKHMGHRIELGEIEAALNGMDFIQVACCLYDAPREKIVCLYQAAEDSKKAIVSALSARLPKYMWPNRYVRFDELPMNSHGKIDRALLKKRLADREI